ncbi:glycoside hydrolase family 2 protein [Immersiella caudata]|uniref:Beta-mannosidase B n=1 Tax=Immersiella caudata TaxID=314043 RepID=A0AA39WJZ5_9PEZI|nr:glycoside hydrolase family 2 protein [Immersiella caudata]
MSKLTSHHLAKNWTFKSSTSSTYLPTTVPSTIHTSLLAHNLISDPFLDLNEYDVSWVADTTWHYRTTFPTPFTSNNNTAVDLIFEGLDTFAAVSLNGTPILQAENMFLSYRVPIKSLLHPPESKEENILEIVFTPAREKGLELVRAHPEHDFIVHQTEVSRGPVRKAQCHWGWDWGPVLVTCGVWKEVRVDVYEGRIGEVRADYEVVEMGEEAAVEVRVRVGVEGEVVEGVGIKVGLGMEGEGGEVWDVEGEWERDGEGLVFVGREARVEGAKLWWPRGYGEQNMYELRVQLLAEETVLDEQTKSIGFRKAELVQEKDAHGRSFYFRINGVDIFSAGSCWIPADSFLTRLTPEDYHAWISLLAEGNQNMIRVWGGGIYEPDAFYEACDTLGILVWQDFMFACASYPTYPAFLSLIQSEALHHLRRLRNHPSLILWCGNNEDYQLIERYNLTYDPSDTSPDSWLRTNFPARYIYEHLLPSLVTTHSPSTPYHPSSPFGNGASTTLVVDPTIGDIHQWSLWHGSMAPYQSLPSMSGRFVSEFGMQSLPHLSTISRFITSPSDLHPSSAPLESHNKAIDHSRRLNTYLSENFRVPSTLAGYVHISQVMQADATTWAYKSWRRQWRTRRCGGVLIWQLNDTWPCTSWSVVDYCRVKKPAWYAIKRVMAPITVGVTREVQSWTVRPRDELWKRDTGHVDLRRGKGEVKFDVWVCNSTLDEVKGRVVVRFVSVESGEEARSRMEWEVTVRGNEVKDVGVGISSEHDVKAGYVVVVAVLWVGGEQVGFDVSWPEPIKYLEFEDRGVRVVDVGDGVVEVSAEKPVKGFVFAERQGMKVSDNGFDLIPGEPSTRVQMEGNGGEIPEWTCVGR